MFVDVPVGAETGSGAADLSLYRILGTQAEFIGSYSENADGTVTIPAGPGSYVLCKGRADLLDAAVDRAPDGIDLGGTQYGDLKLVWYYRLTLTGSAPCSSARFSLPDGVTVPKLYVYELSGGRLTEAACLEPTEARDYVLTDAHEGTYLLLNEPVEYAAERMRRRTDSEQ